MSGFVGLRARKKKRNIFLILGIAIIIFLFFYFFPSLETYNNEIIPNDDIIPNPLEDLTSLASNVEELELNLFQKDQKIKFRDGQIINLQNELKNLKLQSKAINLELKNIKNKSNNSELVSLNKNESLQTNLTKLNIENDKKISIIKDLNIKIDNLNKTLFLSNEDKNDIILENNNLKKNNKIFFANNRKLKNSLTELNQIIKKQKSEIEFQLEKIKILKDKSHHGG